MVDDEGAQPGDGGGPPPWRFADAQARASDFVAKYWHVGAAIVMVGCAGSLLGHAVDGWPHDVVGLVAGIVLLGVGLAVLVIGAPDANDMIIVMVTATLVENQFSSNSVTAPGWASWVILFTLTAVVGGGRLRLI